MKVSGRLQPGLWIALLVVLQWLGAPAPHFPSVLAADGPERLSGHVSSADGQPVAGADVIVAPHRGDGDELLDPDAVHRTKTDAAGHFDLPRDQWASGQSAGSVWVYHRGYRLSRAAAPARSRGAAVQVVLQPVISPAAASVEVVDVRGEPVDRARVIPTRWYNADLAANSVQVQAIPRAVGDLVAGWTGPDGRVVLDVVAALRLSAVAVESASGMQTAEWDESLIARHRVVRLQPVGRVVGVVKAVDPAHAAGLTVRVVSTTPNRMGSSVVTQTDGAGHFEVVVAAGQVVVQILPRPDAAELPTSSAQGILVAEATLSTEIVLRRGVRVSGLVVGGDNG